MKRNYLLFLVVLLVSLSALILYTVNAKKVNNKVNNKVISRVNSRVSSNNQSSKSSKSCVTIQDGTLVTSDGEPIEPGYSQWGYNYQAHLFNGDYCDYHPVYRPGGSGYDWCQENYGDVNLVMKWNDSWLSNQDCDGDSLLDRHFGHDGYIGSGAWETNHMSGSYEQDGKECKWTYFVKIIAVPSDAELEEGVWYTFDGVEIGESIWGSFAIIQQVNNDPCAGYSGIETLSPAGPGFGKYKE